MSFTKILIAPNAFKGSLSAGEAAQCIGDGIRLSYPEAILKKLPIGDGGDGTGRLITTYLGGKRIEIEVEDPLGRIIKSELGFVEEGRTGIIEMARASGISLLDKDERNPLIASSFGTGELMLDVIKRGASKILLTIGGSATVDGGTGILRALGVRFLDKSGGELTDLPKSLHRLSAIDSSGIGEEIKKCEIIVLCDVFNPLLGENGAAAIFGPQKGADENAIRQLESGLRRLSEVVFDTTGRRIENVVHGGAAGGVAAGLFGILNARLVNGSEYFLSLIDFEKAVKDADMIITGEGAIDEQTLKGKGPFAVAKTGRKYNKRVIGIAGNIVIDEESDLWNYFDMLLPINFQLKPLEDAILETDKNLKSTGFNLGRILSSIS